MGVARRHHTGILRRGVWCASRRPPLGVRLFLSLFAVSLRFSLQPSCHLSVVPLSSFSLLSLLPLSRRSPLPRSAPPPPAVPLFSRLLSPFGAAPPSLLHILAPRVYPRARTSLLMPTAIICHPVMSLLRSTLSSNTCAFTDDAGAGVPFGCIVTDDNGISTGSSSSESSGSSPSSFRSALRSVRSAWLTLHAVNRRFIHPIFFSRSSARALVLSLFRSH